MEKIFEHNDCIIEIITETKGNGISSVACIKTFVKPVEGSNVKDNKKNVDDVETHCCEVIKGYVESSDLLSSNHIFDFSCTRNNLNTEKWSRVVGDLYLFTPFVECEEELVQETEALCKMLSNIFWIMFKGTGNFEITKTVP